MQEIVALEKRVDADFAFLAIPENERLCDSLGSIFTGQPGDDLYGLRNTQANDGIAVRRYYGIAGACELQAVNEEGRPEMRQFEERLLRKARCA